MRVGIVNDLPMLLEGLRRIVSDIPGLEVAWMARDGRDAVLKCSKDTPGLLLMDLIMPGINGVEATRRIMRKCPCPILIVTATIKGNQPLVIEALSAGAMDVVRTPAVVNNTDGEFISIDAFQEKLFKALRIIGHERHLVSNRAHLRRGTDENLLIAIGASTGGPKAVVAVLSAMPKDPHAAIVVIVHVSKEFAQGMATWMSDVTGMHVCLAQEGQSPKAGEIVLAATDGHLVLTSGQVLRYADEPEDNPYRPSVDVFFSSLVRRWRGEAVGVLLTGMGADGAKGLLAMRQNGWHTIAQDQASSVIYGMPKAAAKLEAACEVLSLDCIGSALARRIDAFERQKGREPRHAN